MNTVDQHTRFRAYQLSSKGSSFSYWNGSHFTLGEARYNTDNQNSIRHELMRCNHPSLGTLHITSWDQDHCSAPELDSILADLKPVRIEFPGYSIDSTKINQVNALGSINRYSCNDKVKVDEQYVTSLSPASAWNSNDLIYNNRKNYNDPNNNSTVRLFKSGSFSVLSLGDLESPEIGKSLIGSSILREEVDILILPHHGSDNGFTSEQFLDAVKPKVAISLSNWANQHGHPHQNVTNRLRNGGIDYYSTKQGDVIIESTKQASGNYTVYNYISNGERREAIKEYTSKRNDAYYRQLDNTAIWPPPNTFGL